MVWEDDVFFVSCTAFCGVLVCVAAAAALQLNDGDRVRRYKTRPINRERATKGHFKHFLKMKAKDDEQFFKHTRMTVPVFNHLLSKVAPHISKRRLPDSISAEERLAITLLFLSQGGTMQNLAWQHQMGHATVHKIVLETCTAIWEVLSPVYLANPSTQEEWKAVAREFFRLWNFPNCLGALDGKHIQIQCPAKSGSHFFNYKKTFSIVLMAACDANYMFTLVDIGAYGSKSDGGVFRDSNFGLNFEDGTMDVPPPERIWGINKPVPFCLVADEAFPLKPYIMRPYPGRNLTVPQRIFNYRLSRARRCIENTFGILVARWRILRNMISCKVDNVDTIVKACVVLHNFCKANGIGRNPQASYCPPGYVDSNDEDNGGWRAEVDTPLRSVGRLSANNAARQTYEVRATLTSYFMSPAGQLPWQMDRVLQGTEPQG